MKKALDEWARLVLLPERWHQSSGFITWPLASVPSAFTVAVYLTAHPFGDSAEERLEISWWVLDRTLRTAQAVFFAIDLFFLLPETLISITEIFSNLKRRAGHKWRMWRNGAREPSIELEEIVVRRWIDRIFSSSIIVYFNSF